MHRETTPNVQPAISAWEIVGLLSIAFAINYADRQYLFSAFPRISSDLELNSFQLGLAGSLFTWSYAIFMPVSGWIADRWSRSALVVLSVTLWSLACLGTALSSDATQMLISRIVMGISESLYVPSAIRLIAEHHPNRTRSRALSIHAFAQFAGICLGGSFGGWSAEHIGWRTGYELLTVLALFYAFVLHSRIRTVQSQKVDPIPLQDSPRGLLRSPLYYVICLNFFLLCAMLWVIYAWMPTAIHDHLGLSLTSSGMAATVPVQSGAALGVLLGGWVGDFAALRRVTGRLEITAIGLLLCAPFSFLIFESSSLIRLGISAVAFGVCSSIFIANVFASLYDVVSLNSFSLATGVLNMIGGLGGGAAILCAGIMRDRGGITSLMRWIAVFSLVAALSLLFCTWKSFAAGNSRPRSAALT